MSRWVCMVALVLLSASIGWAGDTITLDNLKILIEAETDEREILQLLRRAESVEITDAGIDELGRLGASKAVLDALRNRTAAPPDFGLASVLELLENKVAKTEIIDAILASGLHLQLSGRDKLKLVQAGATADLIKALQGQYVYPGFRRYLPDHRLFAIQHPEDWRASSWYTGEGFKVVLAPTAVSAPNQFTTGVQIQVYRLAPRDLALRVGVHEAWLRKYRDFVRTNKAYELKPVDDASGLPLKARLGGNEAVRQQFFVKMQNTPCREILVESVDEELLFLIEAIAPRDKFAQYAPTFRKMLATFQPSPGEKRIRRRAEPIGATELIERYRESVVQVRAPSEQGTGAGTGFFVREDGYLLTNHHVVCTKKSHHDCTSKSKMKLAKRFEVVWDTTVEPKAAGQKNRSVIAQLVSTVYLQRPRVDLALLKVAPAAQPYRAIPIARVGRDGPTGLVREGDPVLALGFPLPTRLGIGRLTSTTGDLANLQYFGSSFAGAKGGEELDFLLTRLVINPGNSGGPLIDRVSGAVIGLNTAVELATKGQARLVGERLGYSSATAIDYAYEFFPQLRFYPRGRELPPEAHVELATMLITRENLEGAVVELDAALKDRERLTAAQRANLYYQASRYYDKRRSPKPAISMLQQCLVEQPNHTDALIALAYRVPWNELDKAIGYVEKSIQADPTNWRGPYHRAAFYLRAGRHDDALKELQRAETKLGGARQTSLLQLRGQVLYAAKRYDEGRAAYKEALAIEPDSLETRLALADYFARKKNTGGALMEYAQILRDHGGEPLAHERYGRFLRTIPKRRAEGTAAMTRAAKLSLEQRGAPAPGLLRDLARALRTEPKLRAQARVAALLLYRYWPGWRGTAHQELGQAWKLDGRQAIAHAHASAAAALGRPLLIGKPAAKALTAEDAISLVRAGYSMDVYSDVVASTNLGFPVQAATVKQLMSAGMPAQLTPQLVLRSIRDQASGGRALASLVKIKFEGAVQSKSTRGPWSTVKFTNTGGVPLNGLQLKYSYQDANKKSLFSSTHVYALKRGPLLPGTTRKLRFLWHDWKVLKERTKDTKKIKWHTLEAVHARNAEFVSRVSLVGRFAKDAKSYRFTIQNNSAFSVRKLFVRCEFMDTNNKPILSAAGEAIGETIPVKNLTLKPGQKSGELTVKLWADWNHLARLGISRTRYKTVRVRVRVVDGVAFFAKKAG